VPSGSAISSSERISFNIINRRTGHRVERQFVDSETGKPVERDECLKSVARQFLFGGQSNGATS
jgi:non-homologous end joining protein Ku